MHQLIASPQRSTHLLACPGAKYGVQLPAAHYEELAGAAREGARVPGWLVEIAHTVRDVDLDGHPMHTAVLVRPHTALR